MSRQLKVVLFSVLIVFTLACNAVTSPFRGVQNIAETAESFATAMPLETLQALPSAIPIETFESLPSELENFNYFDPQGIPVSNWNGIPIMTQATAGQEFNDTTYSFKVDASPTDVQTYYETELEGLGWSSTFSVPGDENGAVLLYSKDSKFLTITVTAFDGETVVVITLA